jgi:ketosteroid isomerase-like protein
MTNLQTTQQIYEAFGRGDIPAILGKLADDVEWEYGINAPGVPWLERRRGREGAGAFFASLGGLDIQRFAVKNFLDGGKLVIALVDIEFVVKSTGKRVKEVDESHLWHFDDAGRVIRFTHRLDTHQHVMAARP